MRGCTWAAEHILGGGAALGRRRRAEHSCSPREHSLQHPLCMGPPTHLSGSSSGSSTTSINRLICSSHPPTSLQAGVHCMGIGTGKISWRLKTSACLHGQGLRAPLPRPCQWHVSRSGLADTAPQVPSPSMRDQPVREIRPLLDLQHRGQGQGAGALYRHRQVGSGARRSRGVMRPGQSSPRQTGTAPQRHALPSLHPIHSPRPPKPRPACIMLTAESSLVGSGIWMRSLWWSMPTRMPSSTSVGASPSPSPTTNCGMQ